MLKASLVKTASRLLRGSSSPSPRPCEAVVSHCTPRCLGPQERSSAASPQPLWLSVCPARTKVYTVAMEKAVMVLRERAKPSKKAVWCFPTRLPLLSSARGPGWDVGVCIPPGGSGGTLVVTQPHRMHSVTGTFLVPSCDSCLPHPGPIPRE